MPKPRFEHVFSGAMLRNFLLAFSVASLLFSGLILAIYRQDVVNQRTILEQEAEHVLDLQQELLFSELRGVQSDLLYLATQDVLQKFLSSDSSARETLEHEYENFALKKALYDQIRLLDTTGLEAVRINYRDAKAEVVPLDKLQPKASRYYYQQAISLDKGEVFVSPFDLNEEHGKIERPIEPVIRFVTPVIDESGEKRGLLVLNYLGTRLLAKLKQLSTSFRGETMLVNPAGEYLQAPNASQQWGWLLDHQQSFRKDFPDAWAEMERLSAGQLRAGDDLITFRRISPGLRWSTSKAEASTTAGSQDLSSLILISRVSSSVSSAHSRDLLNHLLLMGAGVMMVVALLSFSWARSWEIRRLHALHVAESESRLRHLSRALLEAQETERRNLSRVLHDELGQLVTAIRLDLGSLERKQSNSEANSLLHRAIEETDQLLHSLHEIASRARPSVLDDLGLKDAIETFISEYQRRTGVSVTSHLSFEQDKIPTTIGENAYRIVSEALSNVATHAKVGEVEVTMESDDDSLRISVQEAGVGFETQDLEASTRLGILGMRERAELLNGEFNLVSSPSKGTQILVELPLRVDAATFSESGEA
jgi:signal transduction histidine kinase